MPLISSGGTQLFHKFTASVQGDIITEVSTVLQACGWVATVVTDGIRLQGQSPQGLQIFLYIRDLGHKFGTFFPPQITFNFQTIDGTITGIDHELVFDATYTYQIVACICQIFISVKGVLKDVSGSVICGGIPWIPFTVGPCSNEIIVTDLPDQSFWAMGDSGDAFSPRVHLITGLSPFGPFDMKGSEALWGTDYCAESNPIGSPRILALTVAPLIFSAFNFPSHIRYFNGDIITYEPILVWGTHNDDLPCVRGQVFNSLITSVPFDMDTTRMVEGIPMINFTHQYLYGALHLITTPFQSSGGNYAAIAT